MTVLEIKNESEIGQLNMVYGRATLMNRIVADDLATPNLEQTETFKSISTRNLAHPVRRY